MNPFIPALVIILLGFLARLSNLLGDNPGPILSRIVLNITLPALVLTTVTRAELPGAAFILPGLAIVWSLLMLGLGGVFFRHLPKNIGGVMALSLLGFNIGQFAYPLVEAAWGGQALALLVMFDIGNALMIFSMGYILSGVWAGKSSNPSAIIRRLITFVPLLSYIFALLLNISGLKIPGVLETPLMTLGSANQAIVLLLVGLYLNPKVILKRLRDVLGILAIRYGLGALVGLCLFLWLPANEMIRQVLLVTFLLPVPMSTIPFSVENDLDSDLAGALVNSTIIISFLLLWLVFSILG